MTNIAAISTMSMPAASTSTPGAKADDVAREFEALFWQMLISESHLFDTGLTGSTQGDGGQIGGMLDQILASQLAKGLDLGIGRAALGLSREDGK